MMHHNYNIEFYHEYNEKVHILRAELEDIRAEQEDIKAEKDSLLFNGRRTEYDILADEVLAEIQTLEIELEHKKEIYELKDEIFNNYCLTRGLYYQKTWNIGPVVIVGPIQDE